MKTFQCIAILLAIVPCFAQEVMVTGEITVAGLTASNTILPFWMHANTNTALDAGSTFSGTGEVKANYAISENSSIEAGVAFFYRNGVTDELQRRDLYLKFENNWLKATLGAKKQEILLDGLSATNKNFLWSSNARPLPGLVIEANNPLKISNTFAIDWGIGHYFLNDNRFVADVKVHYKRLGLITTLNENHKITAQLQHFVQWGGTSPVFGTLKNSFSDFIDVFFARSASELQVEGEIFNAVGNHLGSFLLDYQFKTSGGDFSVYHEHPFEDGSGTGFSNFPDGVWGVFFQPKNKKIISSFLYEYIDTNDQSASVVSGFDNYFNNNVYRSGWTYEGNSIGLPFITADKTIEVTSETAPITSNRVKVHHFGISGTIKRVDWKFKSSIAKHLGTYNHPFNPSVRTWHQYAVAKYTTQKYGFFALSGGADLGANTNTIYGGGISYGYAF